MRAAAPSITIYGQAFYGQAVQRRIARLGIESVVSAPGSPWRNSFVERLTGTRRREIFDRVVDRRGKQLALLHGFEVHATFFAVGCHRLVPCSGVRR